MTTDVFNYAFNEEEQFDLLIFAVGYETRARYVAEKLHRNSKLVLGYVFPAGHILGFDANMAFLSGAGGHMLHAGTSIEERLVAVSKEIDLRSSRICVDVSSLNRGAMSALLSELLDSDFFRGCQITVLYAPAIFEPPPAEEMDFLDFGPLERFEGWTSNPEKPSVLILGLGYETDHAVGALEYLDPSSTFAFFPVGSDERFGREVQRANETFLELISPERVVRYSVLSPYQTFWQLRSLILSVKDVARNVLVPMGPKIFCSLCLVCQRVFGDEISVWRASGHSLDRARDAFADGDVVGYLISRSESRDR
ncbi:MAG: hypothetical protein V2I43_10460 [Parvularcula sp.]|jgi:hypothetical protein|nr:hypothetical protein [Parvularcula sp.]